MTSVYLLAGLKEKRGYDRKIVLLADVVLISGSRLKSVQFNFNHL